MAQKEELINFAEDYLECWTDAILEKGGASKWKDDWTNFHEKNVLVPLSDKINAKTGQNELYKSEPREVMEKEYYRIDFILYRYRNPQYHWWQLDYAIEHENEKFAWKSKEETIDKSNQGWFDEFCKLLPIKCAKARVIIGYDLFNAETEARLQLCQETLIEHETAGYNDITDTPILLILFPGTTYIKEHVDKGYSNDMVRVVLFAKQNGIWGREDLFAKMNERKILESKLSESFIRIAACGKTA